MTGPEHYAEAERLLAAYEAGDVGPLDVDLVLAQVHATLAMAAASARETGLSAGDWMAVAGRGPDDPPTDYDG